MQNLVFYAFHVAQFRHVNVLLLDYRIVRGFIEKWVWWLAKVVQNGPFVQFTRIARVVVRFVEHVIVVLFMQFGERGDVLHGRK